MRLIDADEFEVVTVQGKSDDFVEGAQYVLEMIDNMPTIDAEPVVHAKWGHLGGNEWCCTACEEVIHTEGSWENPTKKYCYECGAKMDAK